jgi:calcium-dependent phosphoinositide phospholipase C
MPRRRLRPVVALWAAVLLALSGLGVAAASGVGESAATPFASAVFRSTHNSYSGNVDGAKGSLTYQLDHGVRFLELDVHDNGYAENHDYSIGHDSPGDKVDHAGNPASNLLADWLTEIASWSSAHPEHAPLVVMLDLKDNLTDNHTDAEGNLTALNRELRNAFGAQLLPPADYQPGTTVDALRGKVLPLLSGDQTTRLEYRRDVGAHPAVAVNGNGQIVEVHDSGHGTLWYWTGTYNADGTVTWLRHGYYDTGITPAVTLDDDGFLVEVHQSNTATTLWSRVGQLDADGEISWSAGRQYDNGVLPTVRFTGAGTVREIHRSQSNDQNWTWNGALDTGAHTVAWSGNAKTADPRFDAATSVSGARSVHVETGADGPTPADTLRYTTDQVAGGRIRYEQTAFDEYQQGDSAELQDGAVFYGAPATAKDFIRDARGSGHLVRGWDFDSADLATDPLANYPATNTPDEPWYQTMITDAGAVE